MPFQQVFLTAPMKRMDYLWYELYKVLEERHSATESVIPMRV